MTHKTTFLFNYNSQKDGARVTDARQGSIPMFFNESLNELKALLIEFCKNKTMIIKK